MNNSEFIKAFQIFKENRMDNWVTILIHISEFNESTLQRKIQFHLSLGYQVRAI
jgi:hypothetical protein